ncbi:hypothetical protein [Streptomyces sp. NPDC059761]|uniref:hypothetical protein n=1 Tax=Streptomyces sp. NPDC059761 TaxID=3346937 RepID=UPI003663303C
MPAVERHVAKPVQDFSDIPMTPAMQQINELSHIVDDLQATQDFLGACVVDLTALAWIIEKHTVTNIVRVTNKPARQNASFYNRLKVRGINTSNGGYNDRRRREAIAPEKLPTYLTDPELAEIAEEARRLRERIKGLAERREQKYPALHQRLVETQEAAAAESAQAS